MPSYKKRNCSFRSWVSHACNFYVKLSSIAREKIHIFMPVAGWFVCDAGNGAGEVFDVEKLFWHINYGLVFVKQRK